MHRCATVEVFLYDAAIEHARDPVCALSSLTAILTGPCEVPFANPEVKLLMLGLGAGNGLAGRLAGRRGLWKAPGNNEPDQSSESCRSSQKHGVAMLADPTIALGTVGPSVRGHH
jgi:hypothetical protein